MSLIPQLTDAGRGMLIAALSGSPLNFTKIKIGNGTAPESPSSGDFWYDTDNEILFEYKEFWGTSTRTITIGETAPTAPDENDLWYNTSNQRLSYYGEGWVKELANITCSTTAPEIPTLRDHWYDTANEILYLFGNKWNNQTNTTITCAQEAPAMPTEGDFWYDQANTQLKICTALWAEKAGITLTAADTAPSASSSGDFWYNTANTQLKKCKELWGVKSDVTLISSDTVPETPSENDYWYDTVNSELKKYNGTDWVIDAQSFTSAGTAPGTPTIGDWWYDTESSSLFVYALEWENSTQSFSYAATEPATPTIGDWWYDTVNSVLKDYKLRWENSTQQFSYGLTAPATPSQGDWWYDTSLHVYGTGWMPDTDTTFTYGSAAPSNPFAGEWWYNTVQSSLNAYGMLWLTDTEDNFTYNTTEPARGYNGDLWYDSTNSILKEFSTGWESNSKTFTYSATAPIIPNSGDWWYSTLDDALYEYTGTQWNQNYTPFICSASEPATQDALTDLVNPMISIAINDTAYGTNYISLTGVFDNNNVIAGFNWSETGVFAEDGDGNELLYAYCHAGELGEYIPANDCGKTIETTITLLVMIGDAETVSATIGDGSVYASRKSLEEHKRDFKNPHGVSAEQIGLGNVINVAPANMAIEYNASTTLEEPATGEIMGTVLGKIKKAINALILHLKATNPHGITPSTIKAATASHKHSTNDIDSGVLSTERGGTGCTNMKDFADKLGSNFSVPVFGVYNGTGSVKRLISLDFTPTAVFVCNGKGMVGDDIDGVCGGLAVGTYGLRTRNCTDASHETSWSNMHTALLITTNGFFVNFDSTNKIATNKSGETYRYIAFR